jgi:hypothetical protein
MTSKIGHWPIHDTALELAQEHTLDRRNTLTNRAHIVAHLESG